MALEQERSDGAVAGRSLKRQQPIGAGARPRQLRNARSAAQRIGLLPTTTIPVRGRRCGVVGHLLTLPERPSSVNRLSK
jgi:hypothetical protein